MARQSFELRFRDFLLDARSAAVPFYRRGGS